MRFEVDKTGLVCLMLSYSYTLSESMEVLPLTLNTAPLDTTLIYPLLKRVLAINHPFALAENIHVNVF